MSPIGRTNGGSLKLYQRAVTRILLAMIQEKMHDQVRTGKAGVKFFADYYPSLVEATRSIVGSTVPRVCASLDAGARGAPWDARSARADRALRSWTAHDHAHDHAHNVRNMWISIVTRLTSDNFRNVARLIRSAAHIDAEWLVMIISDTVAAHLHARGCKATADATAATGDQPTRKRQRCA